MTRESWIDAHPWLRPLARFLAQVDAEMVRLAREAPRTEATSSPPKGRFDDYRDDFLAGVPLLRSEHAAIDFEPAGRAAVALLGRLAAIAGTAATPGLGRLSADVLALHDELRREPAAAPRLAGWLLGGDELATAHPGLLRCLGWNAAAATLRPLLDGYAAWRDEERWMRSRCPACGASPAMAQLVGTDPGRMRWLVCGGCFTRWRFGRTACPFCEEDRKRIGVLTITGESGLRLDWCEACRAYLKTYEGEGSEEVLLLDWTSLHLDVAARERGLKRAAASLYGLDALAAAGA